jgi:hypothetical protein
MNAPGLDQNSRAAKAFVQPIGIMSLTSEDPFVVVQSVRAAAHLRAATDNDFVSPAESPELERVR